VLAVLHVILGILPLLGGFVLMVVGFVLPEMFPYVRFAIRSATLGVGLVAFALMDFLLAYGLWRGKGWAWSVSLVFAVLGIILSVFALFVRPEVGELLSLIIDLVIVYYLIQPRVQAFFGRGTVPSPVQPPHLRSDVVVQ
jgi:hypothetical protein